MALRTIYWMARATILLREKAIAENGDILEVAVWRISARPRSVSGVRYRLAFVRHAERVPAVLYDNHSPKWHHRHTEGTEEPYNFIDVDQLMEDFMRDVRQARGGDRWPRR